MIVALAYDSAGIALRDTAAEEVRALGHTVLDVSADAAPGCHYPVMAARACLAVTDGRCGCAVLICGTGVGMSIAANKIAGIRCALCGDSYTAEATRRHNDANALALGARVIGAEVARQIVRVFLTTDFESEQPRHVNRTAMFSAIEQGQTLE